MRLSGGFHPDPLGRLTAFPRPLREGEGRARRKDEGSERKGREGKGENEGLERTETGI